MSESRPVGSVEELYGTWTLISWTRRLLDTGETVEAFGGAPRGLLAYAGTFTFDGNAATHLSKVSVSPNTSLDGSDQLPSPPETGASISIKPMQRTRYSGPVISSVWAS
jgi:hypothetical protein